MVEDHASGTTVDRPNLPACRDDPRQRQGDSPRRVRFRDATWLYLVVALEFQSTVDRYMAVRMLVYVGLLYQELVRRGELGPGGELPPVLPVALYNGSSRRTAADDAARLVEPAKMPLEQLPPGRDRGEPTGSRFAGMRRPTTDFATGRGTERPSDRAKDVSEAMESSRSAAPGLK